MKNINEMRGETQKNSNSLINGMYKNTSYTYTENGALTYNRTESALVDFFALAGAMRNNLKDALDLFKKALAEDNEKAIRILFYLRDIRGGQGERDVFRTCINYLGDSYPQIFEKIIELIPEYGRWDDMFFDNDKVFETIKKQLKKDLKSETPSLLAKWMPTINASSPHTKTKAKFFAKKFGMTEIEYRKTIRNIRKKLAVVEEKMSANQWGEIDYSTVPSRASLIYRNAFSRHDEERYQQYLKEVEEGKSKINAKTLYPYEIYKIAEDNTAQVLWDALPDYTQGRNAIVVADTSGSMTGDPMAVSVSLALYFAERNRGQFKNYFISFSETPKLHRIQGNNLREKFNSIELGDIANTNIQAVFDLILNTAIQNRTPQEEMPETVYIISDMEFDSCATGMTNYEMIEGKYKQAGYKKPNLVFWNVDARQKNLPTMNEQGVALVSGLSPVIFKMAVENKTPYEVMLDTINQPRYEIKL